MSGPSSRRRLAPEGARRGFADHFSSVAQGYATFRPGYPDALFAWLAAVSPARHCAWDCATGSGQAAAGLADYFDCVIATDASLAQVRHAVVRRPNIFFAIALAESSCLATRSVNLVTVAQALHWFDASAFFDEVERVLQPAGILAAWCYGNAELDQPDLQARLNWFYAEVVGPYWPEERRLVGQGYANLAFPGDELDVPSFEIVAECTLPDFLGYVATWSAVQRYTQVRGENPIPYLQQELMAGWGDVARRVRWPLAIRAFRLT